MVYDTSARTQEKALSLNDCLRAGPPLQNKLWSVVVRHRFHLVVMDDDVRRAFLQVQIRETEGCPTIPRILLEKILPADES